VGRLGLAMEELRARGEKAFIPFITTGDPTLQRTREFWRALDRAGSHVIEIGIPFSDPLADGPTIQRASQRALAGGTTMTKALAALAQERPALKAKAVVFTYCNPVMALGMDRFADAADEAGVDAALVPDLIPDEADELREALAAKSIDLVSLVAPTTSDERLAYIGGLSPALVYAVSLTGVTGARGALSVDLDAFIGRCRPHITSPLVIGFGISTPEQAARAAALADGVVVGSALVKLIETYGDSDDTVKRLEDAAKELAEAVRG
jgi:tryptophan synthase alpha chain